MKRTRLRRCLPYVQLLRNIKSNGERRKIVANAPNYILDDMVEILYNILRRNIPIKNKRFLLAMNKYRSPLIKMFNIHSKKGKRRLFIRNQSGGFLGAFIPLIASVLSSAFL